MRPNELPRILPTGKHTVILATFIAKSVLTSTCPKWVARQFLTKAAHVYSSDMRPYSPAGSNTAVVGSNPTGDTNVYVYSAFVLICVGSGIETG